MSVRNRYVIDVEPGSDEADRYRAIAYHGSEGGERQWIEALHRLVSEPSDDNLRGFYEIDLNQRAELRLDATVGRFLIHVLAGQLAAIAQGVPAETRRRGAWRGARAMYQRARRYLRAHPLVMEEGG